jgi:hypothetical protein
MTFRSIWHTLSLFVFSHQNTLSRVFHQTSMVSRRPFPRNVFQIRMGGNALKTVPAERLDLPTYKHTINELSNVFRDIKLRFDFPVEIPGKDSFGDVDVLVELPDDGGKMKRSLLESLQKRFSPPEITNNGPVTSFAYRKNNAVYQIDLIFVKNVEMAKFFFSYGETGMIIGRALSFHGLTFSSEGLSVKIKESYLFNGTGKESDNVIDTIPLSNDPEKICEYLGLSYRRWLDKFSSPEEIYQWVTTFKFYDRKIYVSLSQEKRAKLREFYQNFLKSIQADTESLSNTELKFDLTPAEIYQQVMSALIHFNKINELKPIEDLYLLKQSRREKFNAKLFMENGFEKTKLSEAMRSFKVSRNEDFDQWLDNHSVEEVNQDILQWIRMEKNCQPSL